MAYIQEGFSKILTKEYLYKSLVENKLTQYQIADLVGCTQTVVSKYSRRFKIPLINHHLVYSTNEHYFKTWSSEMAYILGFVTADGYIYEKKNALRIEIKDSDVEILNFIIKEISPNNQPKYRSRKDSRTQAIYNQCSLSIGSKILIEDLSNLGVVPRKTGKEYLPEIPEDFKSDYFRGYFDGDGCFYVGKYGTGSPRYSISIASSSDKILTQVNEIMCYGLGRVIKRKSHHVLIIDNSENIEKICDFMYTNGKFCLQRKKDKYLEFKSYFNREK